MPPHSPSAILLMGPTATGKSALALALADRFDGEIVSVDSAQVYRGMNIGTAKPDAATCARVPHHLIDLIDPTEPYSAARFVRDALAAVQDIRARGKRPLLVGGTMLYFKALLEGLSELPMADEAVRTELDDWATRDGWPVLHAELARVDPVTAARLKPTDAQRIQRALEVWRLTGTPLSQLQGQRQGQQQADETLGSHLCLALLPNDRKMLHDAIARRFDRMLEDGLLDEVRALRARYPLTPSMPSMRCVGYRQVWTYLDGGCDEATLRATGIAATRQLAKRQITWLRSMSNLLTADPFTEDVGAWAKARVEGA
ncbi:MAG: tRNA (adenosine(37)-N6)-dimethylallyltransferase MiaA [Proteobacteria bacterium]|nr:tRNA (adenosine(37)-N6)-dimethylallyltransferase MiaA [Pseudomonadota bacterium]MCL2306660.1 tRNA (adenosine(37)-N6)-dimethylallyltransferase MiaA [Pseudomonadota bacterium]